MFCRSTRSSLFVFDILKTKKKIQQQNIGHLKCRSCSVENNILSGLLRKISPAEKENSSEKIADKKQTTRKNLAQAIKFDAVKTHHKQK